MPNHKERPMNDPMPFVQLTPHQQGCLEWLAQRVKAGAPLLALRGLAGTGKTTLIPALRAALSTAQRPVIIGTPTHRAAMILRQKGIPDADTIHAHALRAVFTPDYTEARAWLGEYSTEAYERCVDHHGPGNPPSLVAQRLAGLDDPPDAAALYALQKEYSASAILSSIGIHGRHHLMGFGPKPRSPGVLIVDEASMVGSKLLPLCQQAFRQVILVGDPGQLAPVQDVPVLEAVEGVELTEIHRQAENSGILRMAYHARKGIAVWRHGIGHPLPKTCNQFYSRPGTSLAVNCSPGARGKRVVSARACGNNLLR
jgi:exodeoxyribonuclease V